MQQSPRGTFESLLTELVIALVVRTRRPFFRSRPGSFLLWSTLALIPLTFVIPFLPFRPSIDQPDGRKIAPADQEILRAERRAMRQVERELRERHEALAREPCGRSTAPFLWRGGSGAGAGS